MLVCRIETAFPWDSSQEIVNNLPASNSHKSKKTLSASNMRRKGILSPQASRWDLCVFHLLDLRYVWVKRCCYKPLDCGNPLHSTKQLIHAFDKIFFCSYFTEMVSTYLKYFCYKTLRMMHYIYILLIFIIF